MTAVTPCAACSDASVPASASTSAVKQRTTCREPAGRACQPNPRNLIQSAAPLP